MSEEKRMTTVWISWDTYRGLLQVKGALRRIDGKTRTPGEVIKELIQFWKKHH